MEEFLEQLREKAVFFKLTSKPKYGGAVSVEDVIKVLTSLTDSYLSFIDAEYSKVSVEQDRKKLKQIKNGLLDENSLIIVDLKFESYGMSVTPNLITYNHTIPQIKNQREWKKEAFENYKSIVLNSDFNDQSYLKEVSEKFTPAERSKIFKPIIDGIINNERATTSFGIGIKPELKALSRPKQQSYSVLVPEPEKMKMIEEEVKTSLAMVEIKGQKTRPKVLELFEKIKNPIFSFNRIVFGEKDYELRFPIYCELIHEENGYVLQNNELGIYVLGENIEEAQKSFFEEFDYIYERYNELSEEQLTADVLSIKKFLNLIVA
jgi:hypothetical protein